MKNITVKETAPNYLFNEKSPLAYPGGAYNFPRTKLRRTGVYIHGIEGSSSSMIMGVYFSEFAYVSRVKLRIRLGKVKELHSFLSYFVQN